jgi:flagellar protein FliJ
MKSRDSLIRLKRFQVDDHRRRIAKIELMINEFNRMAVELDREITNEESKSGITDPSHYAYPTYARSARVRRDNLKQSVDELRGQIDEVRRKLELVTQDLQKAEALDGRERGDPRSSDLRPMAQQV